MGEDEVPLIKEGLDAALIGRPPTAGIGLGLKLFDEFRRRGWLTITRLGEWGDAPAYHASHLTFPNWQLGDLEFRIGGDGSSAVQPPRGLPKAFSPWHR